MKRQMVRMGGTFAVALLATVTFPMASAFATSSGAGASGGGSGGGGTAPPAFSSTTCPTVTVPAAGGTVTCNGATVTVPALPAGYDGINVTVVSTPTGGLTIPGAPAGFVPVYAFTVSFHDDDTGAKYTGVFSPPATVTITNPNIVPGNPIFIFQNGVWTQDTAATVTAGSATFSVPSDPEFAFLASSTTASPIAASTTAVTGKPVLGEGLLAGVLFILGSFGVWQVTRRRTSATEA